METLYIRVEDKDDLDFLQGIFSRVKSITDFGLIRNKRLLQLIEDLEDREDAKEAIEILNSPDTTFYSEEEFEGLLRDTGKL